MDGLQKKIEKLEKENLHLRKSEATLTAIVEACTSKPTENFLSTLVQHVAQASGVKYAFIGEALGPKKDRIRTVASTMTESMEYDLIGTPCETVFGRQLQLYNEKVWEKFPQDLHLLEMGIECYLGVPLFNSRMEPIGIFVIMHDTPQEELLQERELFHTLSRLAGSQLERDMLTRELIKAKNAAEAANRVKDRFLANISHEIRTPLTAILGFAELIRDDDPPLEQKYAIELIEKNGQRLLKLLNDILDIAKIESDHLEVHSQTFPIGEIVDDAFAIFQPSAERKGLSYRIDFDADRSAAVNTDPHRLNQILVNLIDNAIKFTAEGEVGIRVREEPLNAVGMSPNEESLNKGITIEIRDSGVGIAEKDIAKIFEPFSQVETSLNRRYQGAGLGLSICSRLAKLLGAKLKVESKKNQGSLFSITLPTIG